MLTYSSAVPVLIVSWRRYNRYHVVGKRVRLANFQMIKREEKKRHDGFRALIHPLLNMEQTLGGRDNAWTFQ